MSFDPTLLAAPWWVTLVPPVLTFCGRLLALLFSWRKERRLLAKASLDERQQKQLREITSRVRRLEDRTGPVRRTLRLLLVEDDQDLSTVLADRLGDSDDYGVAVATTAAEALRLVRGTRFDLCVLDLRLPDHDGLGMLAALRDAKILVVVYTGRSDEDAAVLALNQHAFAYVRKPDFQGLMAALGRAAEQIRTSTGADDGIPEAIEDDDSTDRTRRR